MITNTILLKVMVTFRVAITNILRSWIDFLTRPYLVLVWLLQNDDNPGFKVGNGNPDKLKAAKVLLITLFKEGGGRGVTRSPSPTSRSQEDLYGGPHTDFFEPGNLIKSWLK